MENEEILSYAEIVDFSEDEEPPSGCESKFSTFVFDYLDKPGLQSPSNPFLGSRRLSISVKNFYPRTDLKELSSWHWPISDAVTSVNKQKFMLMHDKEAIAETPFCPFLLCLTP